MSRGHGEVQRKILAYLEDQPRNHVRARWSAGQKAEDVCEWPGWVTVHHLAATIFNTYEPTRAQVEAVRRAAKRLAEEALAEVGWTWNPMPRRRMWNDSRAVTGKQLGIRPLLSPEEKEAKAAFYAPKQHDVDVAARMAELAELLAPPPAVAEPAAAGRPSAADMPRDDAGRDTPPAGRQEPVTPPAGQETAASGHRPVPEIGPEWTITQPSGPGGNVVLWRDGVRVGTAGRAGLTKAWTATRDSGGTVTGSGAAAGRYSTRIKALMALAVDHEAARRRARRRSRPGAD